MTCLQHPKKQLSKTAYKGMLGISLVEISLSLALVGLTTAAALRGIIREHARVLAQAEASTLIELQNGMQAYLDEFATKLIDNNVTSVSRSFDTSTQPGRSSLLTVTIAAGQQEGESLWPTLQQLQMLRLLSDTFDSQSRISPNRNYKLGRIEILPVNGDNTPLPDGSSCLREGCVLRIMSFTEAPSSGNQNEDWRSFLRSPQVTGQLLQTQGLNTLVAHSTDGMMFDAKGKSIGYTTSKVTTPDDIGVYAEVRIPSLQQRKISEPAVCPAGYFGFGDPVRSPATSAEFTDEKATRCVAAHGGIPVNQQVVAYDLSAPYTGHVRLVCEMTESSTQLEVRASVDAMDPMGPTDFSCKP